MNWIRLFAIGLVLTISGPAFQQPDMDSVKIVTISPDTTTPLRIGETVAFRVELEYNLTTADSGTVTLVIQQGESGRQSLGNETEVVHKGRGRIVMSKDVVVPDTKAVLIFTPLGVQGSTSSRVVDNRAYKVVKN